jgi:hypothetical protein
LFASLVQIDQDLGGNATFDRQGRFVRTQGALLDSPLHFIGFSRGSVVNSEIIQRLGVYFPEAGGVVRDSEGKVLRGDLQMTTIDPHDFAQPSLRSFSDFLEPKVQVWSNVTFADNYYQTLADPDGLTLTPNGRDIPNLPAAETSKNPRPDGLNFPRNKLFQLLGQPDLPVLLNGRAGFTEDNRFGETHGRTLAWYGGTIDLGLSELKIDGRITSPLTDLRTSIDRLSQTIYDQRGDNDLAKILASDTDSSLVPWYSAGNSNEGIHEGWYYSVLGGGSANRPKSVVDRVPLTFDNSMESRMRGDFAVPTLVNGNFDAIFETPPSIIPPPSLGSGFRTLISDAIPGWAFHSSDKDGSTWDLKEWSNISSLSNEFKNGVGYSAAKPNYAL